MPTFWSIVNETLTEWQKDEVPRLGASLAYFAVFSMAPLLVIVIAIVGFAYSGDSVVQIQSHLQSLFGPAAAETLAQAIENAGVRGSGLFASLTSFFLLILGATGVFSELHATMNKIWEVPPKDYGVVWGLIRDRFASFTMVLGIAFLLLISMVLSAVLSGIIEYFSNLLPLPFIWRLGDFAVSFIVVSLLFAALFRFVPDARIEWRDVWIGAFVTALLFIVGKFAIGLYLGKRGVASTFGVAGSVVVILAWVYYTSQLVFLGAEFTHIYAKRRGSQVPPQQPRDIAA